jgi:hypothetical protein
MINTVAVPMTGSMPRTKKTPDFRGSYNHAFFDAEDYENIFGIPKMPEIKPHAFEKACLRVAEEEKSWIKNPFMFWYSPQLSFSVLDDALFAMNGNLHFRGGNELSQPIYEILEKSKLEEGWYLTYGNVERGGQSHKEHLLAAEKENFMIPSCMLAIAGISLALLKNRIRVTEKSYIRTTTVFPFRFPQGKENNVYVSVGGFDWTVQILPYATDHDPKIGIKKFRFIGN